MTNSPTPTALDDLLDLFQMEEVHDGDVLARYVEAHPQFALQLIDLSQADRHARGRRRGGAVRPEQSGSTRPGSSTRRPDRSPPKGANPLDALVGERARRWRRRLGVPRQVVTCLRERKVDPRGHLARYSGRWATRWRSRCARDRSDTVSRPRPRGRSYKADGKPGRDGQVSLRAGADRRRRVRADRARLLADSD